MTDGAPPEPAPASSAWRESFSVLGRTSMRRLWLAQSTSLLGDAVAPIALTFAVLAVGDLADVGWVLAARSAPTLVFVLIGGVSGDRFSRRTILIWTNLGAGASQVALATAFLLALPIWVIAVLAASRGVANAFIQPAFTAAVGHATPVDQQHQAYGLLTLSESVASIAGPVLAGVLLLGVEPALLLLLDAATFVVAALLIAVVGQSLGGGRGDGPATRMLTDLRAGFAHVLSTPWLAAVIASSCAFQVLLMAPLAVLGPIVSEESFGGASAWAAMSAGMGIGSVVGSLVAIRVRPRFALRSAYVLLAISCGPTLLLLSLPAPVPYLVASEVLAGTAIAFFSTVEYSALAAKVPPNMLSRTLSIDRFGSLALRPLALAAAWPLASAMGVEAFAITTGLMVMVCSALPLTLRQVRNLRLDPAPTTVSEGTIAST